MKIQKSAVDAMITHAKNGYPNEACGILAGRPGGSSSRFFPMTNLDASSISYFMDPKEQLRVFKRLREDGFDMTGIFHSHVASEAYPSQKDVRLAFYPDVHYLIASLSDPERPVLRAFAIRNESVKEETIEIEH